LPKKLLEHFKAKGVLELCDIKAKEEIIEIHLEEKNTLPNGYRQSYYESKGLYPSKRIKLYLMKSLVFNFMVDKYCNFSFLCFSSIFLLKKYILDILKDKGKNESS